MRVVAPHGCVDFNYELYIVFIQNFNYKKGSYLFLTWAFFEAASNCQCKSCCDTPYLFSHDLSSFLLFLNRLSYY